VNHPQIAAFARLARENTPPLRKLEGQKTLLSRTMHDLAYDAIHDEIVVTSPFAQAILTFRGSANGEEPPIRVIQGPHTRIVEASALDAVSIDPVNNEIYLATSSENILVFPREANGDVEPIRVIGGPESPVGSRSRMRIDPVRNWLVVSDPRGVLVFDRRATGNARPRAIIPGPTTGYAQFALSPTGLLITNHEPGTIEAWDLEEGLRLFENARSGEKPVLRPTFRIAAQIPKTYQTGGPGITLNPAENEILISDAARNHIWTFVVPEAFEPRRASRTAAR
jgi:hypothetical protein